MQTFIFVHVHILSSPIEMDESLFNTYSFYGYLQLEPQGALIAHLSTMSNSNLKWNQKQQHFTLLLGHPVCLL